MIDKFDGCEGAIYNNVISYLVLDELVLRAVLCWCIRVRVRKQNETKKMRIIQTEITVLQTQDVVEGVIRVRHCT